MLSARTDIERKLSRPASSRQRTVSAPLATAQVAQGGLDGRMSPCAALLRPAPPFSALVSCTRSTGRRVASTLCASQLRDHVTKWRAWRAARWPSSRPASAGAPVVDECVSVLRQRHGDRGARRRRAGSGVRLPWPRTGARQGRRASDVCTRVVCPRGLERARGRTDVVRRDRDGCVPT